MLMSGPRKDHKASGRWHLFEGTALLRKLVLLLILAAVGDCVAQSAPASGARNAAAAQARSRRRTLPGGERTMRGCLAKDDNGGYVLQWSRSGRVKLSSSEDLAAHLGQQVKIAGAFSDTSEPGPSGSSSGGSGAGSGEKRHGSREFRVLKVDVLSPTCSSAPARKR